MTTFNLIREKTREIETNPNLQDCKTLVLAVMKLIDPSINVEDHQPFQLFVDSDGKLAANSSWFFDDEQVLDRKATYKLRMPGLDVIDAKIYGVNYLNKRIISWAQAITPNFEDEPFNKQFPIGIDFFIPKSCDRVLIVLSNNYVIRTLELHGSLTATFEDILNRWESAVNLREKKELLHSLLWDSFDLQPINRQFYQGISQRFIHLRQHLLSSGILNDKQAAHFATRLIGRLVFCWFLRKKKYVDESQGYFDSEKFDSDTDYYRSKLEILFFEVLNVHQSKRRVEDAVTPYLNGGLFEPKSEDLVNEKLLTFPKNYFDDLYSFLASYNFTIDESSSEYQQVAIDPEMLGRIFENLLAEITDDSGEQARTAKGAFYTPREIVDKMCKEALKTYLDSRLKKDKFLDQRLWQLIDASDREFQDQDHNWRRDWKPYKQAVIDALDELRVIDPACGSGAFPMGMLQLLLKVYDRLEPRLDVHKAKLQIISDNLYGVDIEPMAIEISRLRAWLSLIIDLEVDSKAVKPLPNLEFRFVCANSLIPLAPAEQIFGEDPELANKIDDLKKLYFSTESTDKKQKIRRQFNDLMHSQESLFGESKRTMQLKTYRPFDTGSVSAFFDPVQMFGVADFQIVIGNPPYVKKEYLTKDVINELEESYFEVINGKKSSWSDDLYVHFIFRGFDIASEQGVISYITNDSFLGYKTKERVRKLLRERDLLLLLKCPPETFAATIYTAIFLARNAVASGTSYLAGEFVYPSYAMSRMNEVSLNYLEKMPFSRFVFNEDELILKILASPKIGMSLKIVDTGIDSGNVRIKIFSKEKTVTCKQRLLQGKQMDRWQIKWDSERAKFRYCDPDYEVQNVLGIGRGGKRSNLKEYWGFRGPRENHHRPERLLIRQTGDTVVAAYHSEEEYGQFYTDNTLFSGFSETGIPLKYFLAFLNSSIIRYVYQFLSDEKGKTLAQVKIGILEQLPFVYNKAREAKVVGLVDQIMDATKVQNEEQIKQLEMRLDVEVAHLLGLSDSDLERILAELGDNVGDVVVE